MNEALEVVSEGGQYIAELMPFGNGWMTGDIRGQELVDMHEWQRLALAATSAIKPVSLGGNNYKTCTDGRLRLGTLSEAEQWHDATPVREQMVGSSAVSAIVVAHTLGARFFPADILNGDVKGRIDYALDALDESEEMVSTHEACGAAAGLLAVAGSQQSLMRLDDFRSRVKWGMPEGQYDPALHAKAAFNQYSHLFQGSGDYQPQMVTDQVLRRVGGYAVERYHDDGHGVHGHTEQAVVLLADELSGVALSPNNLAAENDGLQLFGVNGSANHKMAQLFSNGGDNEEYYLLARHGLEIFGAAGHGALASEMDTIRVRAA